jgi:hypothetical protein
MTTCLLSSRVLDNVLWAGREICLCDEPESEGIPEAMINQESGLYNVKQAGDPLPKWVRQGNKTHLAWQFGRRLNQGWKHRKASNTPREHG